MATIVEETLTWAQQQVINAYPSAVNSGTAPDEAHKQAGGYHCSVEDLRRYGNLPDYSSTRVGDRPADLTPRGERACCADDISMSIADMKLHHARVRAVFDDRSDPRRAYLNYINTWDGSGDAVRYDFVANRVLFADATHKWHRHADKKRIYQDLDRNEAECWKAARAGVSVEIGQSKEAWLEDEEGDLPVDQGQFNTLMDNYYRRVSGADGTSPALRTIRSWHRTTSGSNEVMYVLTAQTEIDWSEVPGPVAQEVDAIARKLDAFIEAEEQRDLDEELRETTAANEEALRDEQQNAAIAALPAQTAALTIEGLSDVVDVDALATELKSKLSTGQLDVLKNLI